MRTRGDQRLGFIASLVVVAVAAGCGGPAGLPMLDDSTPVPGDVLARATPSVRAWAAGRPSDDAAILDLVAPLPGGAPRLPELPSGDPTTRAPAAFVVATRDGIWLADVDVALVPRTLRRIVTLTNGAPPPSARPNGATIGLAPLRRALTARVHSLRAVVTSPTLGIDPPTALVVIADRELPFSTLLDVVLEAGQSELTSVFVRARTAAGPRDIELDLPRVGGTTAVFAFWVGAHEVVLDAGSTACDATRTRACRRSPRPNGPSACAELPPADNGAPPPDEDTIAALAISAAPGLSMGDVLGAVVQCHRAPGMTERVLLGALGGEPPCTEGRAPCAPLPAVHPVDPGRLQDMLGALDHIDALANGLSGDTSTAPGPANLAPPGSPLRDRARLSFGSARPAFAACLRHHPNAPPSVVVHVTLTMGADGHVATAVVRGDGVPADAISCIEQRARSLVVSYPVPQDVGQSVELGFDFVTQ